MNLLIGRPVRALALVLAVAAGSTAATAQERMLPVPSVTINPGETISESMIMDRGFVPSTRAKFAIFESRAGLVGKVARRTLVAGNPIPLNAVDEPTVVTRGVPTEIVFKEGGLTITAYAAPLQSGAVGEYVRARNMDTGLVIGGVVQEDGTLRVGGP